MSREEPRRGGGATSREELRRDGGATSRDATPRRTTARPVLWVLLLLLGLACASTVPATVTQRSGLPIDAEAPVFVFADRERDAVVTSLEKAGVRVAPRFEDMVYALEVRLGNPRGSDSCGATQNVSFALIRAGHRLLVIKGRGATGNCDPHVFDDMSRVLAANMR